MAIQIVLGIISGLAFGVLQMLVLKKVVGVLTNENGGSGLYILLLMLQFFVFVSLLVLIGRYSIITALISGVVMSLTALVIWIKYYKK
jgi:hypothetical protein